MGSAKQRVERIHETHHPKFSLWGASGSLYGTFHAPSFGKRDLGTEIRDLGQKISKRLRVDVAVA